MSRLPRKKRNLSQPFRINVFPTYKIRMGAWCTKIIRLVVYPVITDAYICRQYVQPGFCISKLYKILWCSKLTAQAVIIIFGTSGELILCCLDKPRWYVFEKTGHSSTYITIYKLWPCVYTKVKNPDKPVYYICFQHLEKKQKKKKKKKKKHCSVCQQLLTPYEVVEWTSRK